MGTQPLPVDRIGQRFSIRLHDPAGGYRDVVGHLKSANTVVNRHGTDISFDPNQIFTWREIIERPKTAGTGAPLTLRVMELDQICNATWPAVESLEVDGWLFRASSGVTNRANSVLPLLSALESRTNTDFINKLASAREFYVARNLPTIFQIALPVWQELAAQLISAGAVETIRGNTMVADLNNLPVNLPTGFEIQESDHVTQEWLAVNPTAGLEKIIAGCKATYLSISQGKKIVATVRTAITTDWSSLTRVYVDNKYRGLGLGKAIVSAAIIESVKAGATKAVLQVEANNSIAIGIYESLGFKFHHEYVYLELK